MSPDPRRNSRGSGPGGRRPRSGAAGPGRSAERPSERVRRTPVAERAPRPKFTGRAAILVVVLTVLAVSYASSAKAYLRQRSQLDDLHSEIAQREAAIASLERQKERWQDPAYVQQVARERFNYIMPGQTSYVVLGEDGKPLEAQSELGDPASVGTPATSKPWWSTAWDSMELAGDPPSSTPPPAAEIDGSKETE